MSAEVSDLIRQLDQAGEITPSDLSWLVTHIANELGNLIRLSGAAVASVLRTRGIAVSDGGALGGTGVDSGYRDRVALRVKEAAKMLGVSSSAMYEMIVKRQIGVIRLGDHRSIRIPKTEIERLLSENLVPALRV
jgi:excisionase family DNA binding protein